MLTIGCLSTWFWFYFHLYYDYCYYFEVWILLDIRISCESMGNCIETVWILQISRRWFDLIDWLMVDVDLTLQQFGGPRFGLSVDDFFEADGRDPLQLFQVGLVAQDGQLRAVADGNVPIVVARWLPPAFTRTPVQFSVQHRQRRCSQVEQPFQTGSHHSLPLPGPVFINSQSFQLVNSHQSDRLLSQLLHHHQWWITNHWFWQSWNYSNWLLCPV